MKEKNHIIYKIYSKNTIEKLVKKVSMLGVENTFNLPRFLTERLIISGLLFIGILIMSKNGYIWAPFLTVVFYMFIEYVTFDKKIKKRAKKLEEEATFFFEVLNLTIEAGRNLKAALDMTSNNIDSELSKEFQKMLEEVKLGKSFREALEAMKLRIPSDSINNIILSLLQSSIYGSSITESLNNQLEYLKEKQMLEIKAEITKLPTKISVVSVVFFIPIMLLIVLSPVIIQLFSK